MNNSLMHQGDKTSPLTSTLKGLNNKTTHEPLHPNPLGAGLSGDHSRQLNKLWPALTPACRQGFDSLQGRPTSLSLAGERGWG